MGKNLTAVSILYQDLTLSCQNKLVVVLGNGIDLPTPIGKGRVNMAGRQPITDTVVLMRLFWPFVASNAESF